MLLGIGLLYLTWTPAERWKEQRTTFKSIPILTVFWIISLLYVIGAPFIQNNFLESVPFYVVPVLGTSLLVLGLLYWFVWAKLLPLFGFSIQHEIEQLPDGSERVRYIVSNATSPKNPPNETPQPTSHSEPWLTVFLKRVKPKKKRRRKR